MHALPTARILDTLMTAEITENTESWFRYLCDLGVLCGSSYLLPARRCVRYACDSGFRSGRDESRITSWISSLLGPLYASLGKLPEVAWPFVNASERVQASNCSRDSQKVSTIYGSPRR